MSNSIHRVAITGIGLLTPFGSGIDHNWDCLVNGQSSISKISEIDASHTGVSCAGEIKSSIFDPLAQQFPEYPITRFDKATLLSLIGTGQALDDAGLDPKTERVGLMVGTGFGTIYSKDRLYVNRFIKGRRVPPRSILMCMDNAPASEAAIYYHLQGANTTSFSACSSGVSALGCAYRSIRHGYENTLVVSGIDTPINASIVEAWDALRILNIEKGNPGQLSRPFCKTRNGFVLSEGGGFVVLENLEHAKKRGAKIYAEMAGFATNCDASHITAPNFEMQASAITDSLNEAQVDPSEVDYISAHGTSTQLNDLSETHAIKRVFGDNASKVPVSALKSQLGHSMGASGMIEVVMLIEMMKRNTLLPTINLTEPDPECDLDYVPNTAREVDKIDCVLKNSFGFGGNNVTLVLKSL